MTFDGEVRILYKGASSIEYGFIFVDHIHSFVAFEKYFALSRMLHMKNALSIFN
jgi:hypothetical protein